MKQIEEWYIMILIDVDPMYIDSYVHCIDHADEELLEDLMNDVKQSSTGDAPDYRHFVISENEEHIDQFYLFALEVNDRKYKTIILEHDDDFTNKDDVVAVIELLHDQLETELEDERLNVRHGNEVRQLVVLIKDADAFFANNKGHMFAELLNELKKMDVLVSIQLTPSEFQKQLKGADNPFLVFEHHRPLFSVMDDAWEDNKYKEPDVEMTDEVLEFTGEEVKPISKDVENERSVIDEDEDDKPVDAEVDETGESEVEEDDENERSETKSIDDFEIVDVFS